MRLSTSDFKTRWTGFVTDVANLRDRQQASAGEGAGVDGAAFHPLAAQGSPVALNSSHRAIAGKGGAAACPAAPSPEAM